MSIEISWQHKAKRGLFIFFGVFIAINLSRGIWGLLQAEKNLRKVEVETQALLEEKKALEFDYAFQTSPEYTEQQIREKLSMAKPGEQVVIIPPEAYPSITLPSPTLVQVPDSTEIWRQWLQILANGGEE